LLLNHEYVELTLMSEGYSKRAAHEIANLNYNYQMALKNKRKEK
jgi:hypothetical protein